MELAIGQQHLGLAVLEAEGDQGRVETDVDRVQHRADHGRREMRFQHGRCVGGEDRHGIPALHSSLGQGMRQLPRAGVELAVGETALAMEDRDAIAEKLRGPGEEAHGAQWHEIGGALAQFRSVDHRFCPTSVVIPLLVAGIHRAACSGARG